MAFEPFRYPIAFSKPRYLTGQSAWAGHIPFAWMLIEMLHPRSIVELGTHYGDSYCAMCQAVADLSLQARCVAVDTWQGDHQVGGYPDHVFNNLRAYHDPAYGSFSTLVRSTFDEAVPRVDDGAVDLLHIDGLHTYEAVKHDFETWQQKVSRRGVVLFHDTAARHADFGVWRLWAELEQRWPSYAFSHTFGLGVLAVGDEPEPQVIEFLAEARRQPQVVDAYFAALGSQMSLTSSLVRWGQWLERARALVQDWRRRAGRPLAVPPPDSFDFGRHVCADVEELLGSCNPPTSAVSSAQPESSSSSPSP